MSLNDFPTPSEFMRGRRPEQFSDSRVEESIELDAGLLEYKLESITSRNEEKQFEHLARRLAERLICPNLIPQTGPTGGGDSKVDTETFPVHEDISSRWYEGNIEAANERWGFAVSAKKQWQGKLRSDMASIASTGRGYKVAYFVSNQFISDKSKSKFQDTLSKEHGFDIRILDRTWIMEAIISKGNEDIASQALNLSSFATTKKIGPNDSFKKENLNEVERKISNIEGYNGVEYQLVEDCISAAIISRELELDRHLTEGRHERAIRLARKHGTQSQITSALYQKAWTAVYWHDDFEVLLSVYDEIEAFSLGSRNSTDVEKAINLWHTLHTAVISKALSLEETKLADRATRLIHHLEELSCEADRPNNAANSKWLKLGIQITQSVTDEERRDTLLRAFGDLLVGSQHLGGFEFSRAYDYFEILRYPFGELEVYDEIFEKILPVYQERHSDAAVADKLFNRGIDKLRADKVVSSIDLLGRALPRLIKAEKKERMIRCLMALASAYGSMDLFWAAYANYMSALSILMQAFEESREIDPLLPMLLERMFWGEISTGRIPHALWCLELHTSILKQLGFDLEEESTQENYQMKSAVLAMLILKADADQLKEFTGLIDLFENNNLIACSFSLIFSFGGPSYLRKYKYVPDSASDLEIWDLMKSLWDQPAQNNLPERIETFGGSHVSLASRLLGTRWEIICQHNPWCIRIGESYASFLEALLATSLSHQAAGIMERAKMRFQLAPEAKNCPNELGLELQMGSGSELATVTIWPEHFPLGSLRTDKLRDFFLRSLSSILPRILFTGDTEALLGVVAGSEEGLNRSLAFFDILASSSNVFHECSSPSLDDWAVENAGYEIVTTPPCNLALQSIMSLREQTDNDIEKVNFGKKSLLENFPKHKPTKHSAYQNLSMVDTTLWNEALWVGVGFGIQPRPNESLIILAFIFRKSDAGRRIFENWIADVGQTDINEKIRIVIVTGIEASNPNTYTIAISSNINKYKTNNFDQIFITSRVKTIENPNPKNLEHFKQVFSISQNYLLVPATMSEDGRPPEFHSDLSILKREIVIREAWTIGPDDPDCMAIPSNINPIIPKDEKNAPILELIKNRKEQRP